MVSEEDVKTALNHLTEPLTGLSFLQAGLIEDVRLEQNKVKIVLRYPSPLYPFKKEVKKLIESEVRSLDASFEVLIEEGGMELPL